jgi:hypothetical protein
MAVSIRRIQVRIGVPIKSIEIAISCTSILDSRGNLPVTGPVTNQRAGAPSNFEAAMIERKHIRMPEPQSGSP